MYEQMSSEMDTESIEGESLEITDGAYWKMNTTIEGNTEQESTSPDRPQNIRVVTGDNTIEIQNSDSTKSQSYLISLNNLELCKVGNYHDYIYGQPNEWYVKKNIGKVNAKEFTWTYLQTSNNLYLYTTLDMSRKIGNDIELICTHFEDIGVSGGPSIALNKGKIGISAYYSSQATTTGNKRIYIVSTIDNINDFQTFLNNNDVFILYPLATATDIAITDQVLIQQLNDLYKAKTYQGVSYITVDTQNEQPILKIDYKKSNLLRIKALEEANSGE